MTSTLRFTFTTDNSRTRHVAIHTNDRIDTLHSYLAMYGHPTALEVITDNDRDTKTRIGDQGDIVPTGDGKLTQITVDGKPYRCSCGSNVFRHISNVGDDRYRCNACGITYGSDRVQPTIEDTRILIDGELHTRCICGNALRRDPEGNWTHAGAMANALADHPATPEGTLPPAINAWWCNDCKLVHVLTPVHPTVQPHSQSCGYQAHPHGPDCGVDCPTCSGRPLPAPEETLAPPT